MFLRYFGKQGVVSLLVVASLMVAGGSAWAAHDCCTHPSDSPRAADSGTNESPDGDCDCCCCQAETAIPPLPGISFQFNSWWSVESVATFAVSRFETDIFRPPLA
jgi:hypothetical protein